MLETWGWGLENVVYVVVVEQNYQMGEFTLIKAIKNMFIDCGGSQIGDDAAILDLGDQQLVVSNDLTIEGVHLPKITPSNSRIDDFGSGCDISKITERDFGYKSITSAISDIAAMGAEPRWVTLSLCGPVGSDLLEVMEGVKEACVQFECDLIGGDLSVSPVLMASVTAMGTCKPSEAVPRDTCSVGEAIWVTGPCGGARCGLRLINKEIEIVDDALVGDLISKQKRPVPRLKEAILARLIGASSMIDISDGLAHELDQLANGANVGISIDTVPIYDGATLEDALYGGEDYELIFTLGPEVDAIEQFQKAGLNPPIKIGMTVKESELRKIGNKDFLVNGFEAKW
ncbi:MAG: thiamine-monophosphate kinase [Acidimicrobiales bacterium]|nr:thiamine-monophosphate kinase [Acidimicrobiales bacterium]